VEDLESTNGTQVNGERVSRAVLRTGDTLTVGRVNFSVLPG
jgi:pSer/pThr/pTyr-binding forkhead associated (FHA) protein